VPNSSPLSTRFLLFAFCLLIAIFSVSLFEDVYAHESRPIYVKIQETEPYVFSFTVKTPRTIPQFNIPSILAPRNCKQVGRDTVVGQRDSYVKENVYRCDGGVSGEKIELSFPAITPSVQTLIRLQTLSGLTHSKLLDPGKLAWEVPAKENKMQVAKDYTSLGVRHILEGYDHLLFLACLIMIAGTGRRILITVTGFTLAHSITLALSAFNLLRIPSVPVEAAIALSIVFLASEIAKEPRDTLTYKYPALVSVAFGLLHGLGFASVLRQIGLPQTEIVTGLLFFNIGVEIGQLAFIAMIILIYKLFMFATKKRTASLLPLEKPAAYVVGSIAAFWMIERIYSFWY
jgi:hypothetical protein